MELSFHTITLRSLISHFALVDRWVCAFVLARHQWVSYTICEHHNEAALPCEMKSVWLVWIRFALIHSVCLLSLHKLISSVSCNNTLTLNAESHPKFTVHTSSQFQYRYALSSAASVLSHTKKVDYNNDSIDVCERKKYVYDNTAAFVPLFNFRFVFYVKYNRLELLNVFLIPHYCFEIDLSYVHFYSISNLKFSSVLMNSITLTHHWRVCARSSYKSHMQNKNPI